MAKSDEQINREYWESRSDEYQEAHGPQLNNQPCAWGVWGIPEDELQVLGDVEGKKVMELGCGGAQWSVFLKGRGASPVGLDFSLRQLRHARRFMASRSADLPLVAGSAEQLPFADDSFDVVFCDHGAMSFADPSRVVPEVARVMRPGGLFAFNRISPIHACCYDAVRDETTDRLVTPYFEMGRLQAWGSVDYHLAYGEWIRLFARSGLVVEDLIELRPPEGATTTYQDFVPYEWARRWPAENIWKVRKR